MTLNLDELIDKLQEAKALTDRMRLPNHPPAANAGAVRFRFAVKWGEYGTSPVSDLDPFGEIVGVTTTLDGTTIVDVLAELYATRQETFD